MEHVNFLLSVLLEKVKVFEQGAIMDMGSILPRCVGFLSAFYPETDSSAQSHTVKTMT